jgi:hypothetical protein
VIDRSRLAEIAERCRAGQQTSEDVLWLIEQVERLADDNQRLSRLVADITEMVRDAKRRRLTPIADDIESALRRDGEEDGER